ncbi:MAG: FecR family protein [Spirochaetales bacterium]|nr:FecR family protein [Spirochaetales bacterium]
MKKGLILILTALIGLKAFALTGEIVYLEGTVDIKPNGGDLEWADFGTPVSEGDSIITGIDGYCEIELEGGSSITIMEESVFSFGRGSVGSGEPQNVFSTAMGQISYKFANLQDEPIITTPSVVCGIRGTAFTVITGADCSSLFIVSEGEVEVESMGQRVSLTLDEAVEVPRGAPPEEKYPVLSGSIDFDGWLEQAEAAALADPITTVEDLTDRLIYFISEMDRYHAMWEKGMAERDVQLALIKQLKEEGKDDEAEDIYRNILQPHIEQVHSYGINVRYYSLSALSLRRYTLGPLYVKLRTAHFKEKSDSFEEFLDVYNTFIEDYYAICQKPYLVEADI